MTTNAQGGGMGAGKTTLKRMVMQSEFYRRYGNSVVAVEADHFKVCVGRWVLVWGVGYGGGGGGVGMDGVD
jgi:hypothetical protein